MCEFQTDIVVCARCKETFDRGHTYHGMKDKDGKDIDICYGCLKYCIA